MADKILKKALPLFAIGFIYFVLTGILINHGYINYFANGDGSINYNTILILGFVIMGITTAVYVIYDYYIDPYLKGAKYVLIAIPIIVILFDVSSIFLKKNEEKKHNTQIESQFKQYEEFVTINEIEYRFDPATNDVVIESKDENGKNILNRFPSQTLRSIGFNSYAKYMVYELENGYIFASKSNPDTNWFTKKLDEKGDFYKLGLKVKDLKPKLTWELTVINNQNDAKYENYTIDGVDYKGIIQGTEYHLYKKYFETTYVLYRRYNIRNEFEKEFGENPSISVSQSGISIIIGNEQYLYSISVNKDFSLLFTDQ